MKTDFNLILCYPLYQFHKVKIADFALFSINIHIFLSKRITGILCIQHKKEKSELFRRSGPFMSYGQLKIDIESK